MKVTLIQQTENPIQAIARIASVCYDTTVMNPYAMVKKLYENGHESVFEHIYFTFHIEGISRACSHQLVRHRMCAFTQRSQRYCEESPVDVVLPYDGVDIRTNIDSTYDLYKKLIDQGVKKEDARYILPNAATTELYLSCNLRELIHIANERLCSHAQEEIREVVKGMRWCVDRDLQWMLVPRCGRKTYLCQNPCRESKKNVVPFEVVK